MTADMVCGVCGGGGRWKPALPLAISAQRHFFARSGAASALLPCGAGEKAERKTNDSVATWLFGAGIIQLPRAGYNTLEELVSHHHLLVLKYHHTRPT